LETKKTLHLAIAGAILKVHGDQQAPLLAHHFRKADDDRAARYSGLAGETCVHSSPEEAVRLLTQAIELAGPLDQRDLPRWGRLLAEALFDQGRVPEAAQKLESVCAASSSPLPNSRLGWYFSLFFAVAVQLLHVITKRSARAASKVDSSELVFAYDKLAEIYFFQAEN